MWLDTEGYSACFEKQSLYQEFKEFFTQTMDI